MGRGSSKVGGGGGGSFKLIEDAKVMTSGTEADDFFGNNLDVLTDKERSALAWYTGSSYGPFNESLRNDKPNHPNRMKSMDEAIAKGVLNEPITVYRGSTADLLGFKSTPSMAELKSLVGGEFIDKAFVSSSAVKGQGSFTHKPIQYKITVPAGKGRGQYIRKLSQISPENEFLMKRNTKFRVTKVEESGGKPLVHLQVID